MIVQHARFQFLDTPACLHACKSNSGGSHDRMHIHVVLALLALFRYTLCSEYQKGGGA